jgi:hypothetical protein
VAALLGGVLFVAATAPPFRQRTLEGWGTRNFARDMASAVGGQDVTKREGEGNMGNEERGAAAGQITSILPPGWEMVDWAKRRGTLHLHAMRSDGRGASVSIDTLPMICESDPLRWLKQVLDLELLWAIS